MKRGNAFKNRTGEKYITNEGYEVEVIEYFSAINLTIKYEDGFILRGIQMSNLKAGQVKKPHTRLGEKYTNNTGLTVIIIDYIGYDDVSIQFEDGTVLKNRKYSDIVKGEFKNSNYPSIFGTAYIGVGVYGSISHYKIYTTWKRILERCYNKKFQEKHPTYKDATVCEDWYNFQNFAEWMDENWKPHMEGWHLDKDILLKGNKVYSPETCAFVPAKINSLLISCKTTRGKYPIGVTKQGKKFTAQITKNTKHFYLGIFDTPEEAFQVYKTAKEFYIKEVADRWRVKITDRVYKILINYKIKIDD